MSRKSKEIIYGLYDDDSKLVAAIKKAKAAHLSIWDVFTPFPNHAIDEAMELSESRLHYAGFIYGTIGALTAFLFMTWVFVRDWPIIFGGKPYWSVPAFIPITFELTVLFAGVGMVVTFYVICGLGPGITNETLDDRITDDKFCLAFDASHGDADKFRSFLKDSGAEEIDTKTIKR